MTLRLGDDPDKSWERFGSTNPYYGVITNARFKGSSLSGAEKKSFFRSGEEHIENVFANAGSIFDSKINCGTALDFGCGVGRLTLPLAHRFKRVLAMDISPSMLDVAKKNCADADVKNVEFLISDDALSRLTDDVDFIHSYIVLQHIPVRRGLRILSAMLDRLRDGGIAAIDVPLNTHSSPVRRMVSAAKKHFIPLQYLHNLLRLRLWNDPLMQTNCYSLNDIASLLIAHGITEYHATIQQRGARTPHDKTILYFRKSSEGRVYP